jgi:deoxyadenosine/deoxycytidine kinase
MLLVISLHGTLCSGKTSLLKELKNKSEKIEVCFENLCNWESFGSKNENLLQLFYEKKLNPFAFQTYVAVSLAEEYSKAKSEAEKAGKKVLICERSVFDNIFVFSKILVKNGQMSFLEYEILEKLINDLVLSHGIRFDQSIYLRCSPETALERCKNRNRSAESGVHLDLLRNLEGAHEEMWAEKPNGFGQSLLVYNTEKNTTSKITELILNSFLQK